MSYPANEYTAAFLNHREPLLELLEMIPGDQGEFKIYPDGLSIRQQVDQLFGFDANVLGALTGSEVNREASSDLRTATARLRDATPKIAGLLKAMNSEQLDSPLEVEGTTRTVYQWLDFVREHEVHHKGQLWMAARMLNIEPPYYIKG
jgi:DinB family